MNDRYLYRAKRTDNGEWVEGYLIYAKKDYYICENPYECMSEYSSLNGQSYGFGGFKLVDPSTICQCTGLKDKNGKLIWEKAMLAGNGDFQRIQLNECIKEQCVAYCKEDGKCHKYMNEVEYERNNKTPII